MYKAWRTSIRLNTLIPFWEFRPEQLDKIKSTYDDTGKRIFFKITISKDGLQEIRETIWDSIDSQKEYSNEFLISWKDRDEYNAANRIRSTVVFYQS
jgi:hypothetical protein